MCFPGTSFYMLILLFATNMLYFEKYEPTPWKILIRLLITTQVILHLPNYGWMKFRLPALKHPLARFASNTISASTNPIQNHI